MEGPERPYRLSDSERDEALARLGTALEEGRLDLDEHEARSARAMRALTSRDLAPLLHDLPSGQTRAPVPAPRREDAGAEPAATGADSADPRHASRPWHLVPYAVFAFVFSGLPALYLGTTEAVIGASFFFAVLVVPYVVAGAVHRRRST